MSGFESNRNDYQIILQIIKESSTVLDLGCEEGDLLYLLEKYKKIKGSGVEISEDGVRECVKKGLSVYQGDIDAGLSDYEANSVDYVLLVQTLQVVHKPSFVINEMLRVGKQAIITFPNFAYWGIRLNFLITGTMPRTPENPYEWYNSPNIHHLSIRDFQIYCSANRIRIIQEKHFKSMYSPKVEIVKRLPNLFAGLGVFVITKM